MIRFGYLIFSLFIAILFSSNAQAKNFVEIQIDEYITFQTPKSWEVLSENNTIKLNSFLGSILCVQSDVRFQANLKNEDGKVIATVQIYKWKSDFDQTYITGIPKNEIDQYEHSSNLNDA